jgi:hypothetical protein
VLGCDCLTCNSAQPARHCAKIAAPIGPALNGGRHTLDRGLGATWIASTRKPGTLPVTRSPTALPECCGLTRGDNLVRSMPGVSTPELIEAVILGRETMPHRECEDNIVLGQFCPRWVALVAAKLTCPTPQASCCGPAKSLFETVGQLYWTTSVMVIACCGPPAPLEAVTETV